MKKLSFVIIVILCFSYVGGAGLNAAPSTESPVDKLPDLPKKMERFNSVLKELDKQLK